MFRWLFFNIECISSEGTWVFGFGGDCLGSRFRPEILFGKRNREFDPVFVNVQGGWAV